MKVVALEKARDHLDLAKDFAAQLDLENGFKAYNRAWSQFLSQVSRFYSKMEQGSKGCNTSEPWFGGKKHERKKDPLLSYLHHARDVDEHGLDYITAKTGSSAKYHMVDGATELHAAFDLMIDSLGRPHVRNLATNTPEAFSKIELVDPRVDLVTVHDRRFGDSFDAPQMHLGKPIVHNNPASVAELAITYLEDMLAEALKLPDHV